VCAGEWAPTGSAVGPATGTHQHAGPRALRTAALGLTLGDERCRREPPFGALEVAGCDSLRVSGGDAIEGGGPELHVRCIGTGRERPKPAPVVLSDFLAD